MADAPAAAKPDTPPARKPAGSGGATSQLTRKIGPLPLYAWAGVVVVAYLLYRHFKGASSSSSALGGTAADTAQTYVPAGDQSGSGSSDAGSSPAGVGVTTAVPDTATDNTTTTGAPTATSSVAPPRTWQQYTNEILGVLPQPITPNSSGSTVAAGTVTASGQVAAASGTLRGVGASSKVSQDVTRIQHASSGAIQERQKKPARKGG